MNTYDFLSLAIEKLEILVEWVFDPYYMPEDE